MLSLLPINMRLLIALFLSVCVAQIKGNEYSAPSNSGFQGSSISNHNGKQEVSASYVASESGGEILTRKVRNVSPDQSLRWTDAVIPYVIDDSMAEYTDLITQVMQDIQSQTCIKFVERTDEINYIRMFSGQGCEANVGMTGGEAPVSIGNGCQYYGTIAHLLGHVLGLYDEQNRSDRDHYLTIYWYNIQRGKEGELAVLKPEKNLILVDFDYDSVMLDGNYYLANNEGSVSKTIVAKDRRPLLETYAKTSLTEKDIYIINTMYSC